MVSASVSVLAVVATVAEAERADTSAKAAAGVATDWGGDRGGSRFSPLAQITSGNVGNLVRAWEFRTGDLDSRAPEVMKRTKFQATPRQL